MELARICCNDDGSFDVAQTLEDHLKGTAEFARQFAEEFNSGEWAYVSGMLHDVGKKPIDWQNYLKNGGSKIEHAIYGAKLAEEKSKKLGRVLSYIIAGHHTGLPDYTGEQSSLNFRLQHAADKGLSSDIQMPEKLPWKFDSELGISLWIRMLFSCLVDADRLDTERFCNPNQYRERGNYLPIDNLCDKLDRYIKNKVKNISKDKQDTAVFAYRQMVLEDCITAAGRDAGFFSLTVPTGGGKTLSSMAFALNHAKIHNKKRIIYVIPYTSIIEQTADVFKEVFGQDQVIEHHSSIDVDDQKNHAKLATENWDAPIIVTTTVQFYGSLFSAKTSKCRKLHNIANSIVILDETQLLPVEFFAPILKTLKLLTTCYKATIVFCTATQPALEEVKIDNVKKINISPIEIIEDVDRLYNNLQRVSVQMPAKNVQMEWQDLANELQNYEQVLCVVSDRQSARELHRLMPKGTYHLSALMCAEHRSQKIKEIKDNLTNGVPIRVISTQLVEAGVDIDFPVVYRQMAGLDSIAQAAGRCNREGKLKEGKVVVFNSTKKSPSGLLRKATETTLLLDQRLLEKPLAPESFKKFFELFYWKVNSLDEKNIVGLLTPNRENLGIQFREADGNFKIIDDKNQRAIIVPYDEKAESYINMVKSKIPQIALLRKLQRYSVNIYENQFLDLYKRGSLVEILPEIFALICKIEYSDDIGLLIDEYFNPNDLVR